MSLEDSQQERLEEIFEDLFERGALSLTEYLGELTLEVISSEYLSLCKQLQNNADMQMDQLIDLCGVDYSEYSGAVEERYAVVVHLLSTRLNERLRVRVFATDDELPVVESLTDLWKSADWYEREAFDLFGILFAGHNDLRRILTDYNFVGHPFRKDFPVEGNLEMRYDEEQKRVIYEPVTIENRVVTPRVIREDSRYV
ncbi:MAG: NADH-quinone oxidoreductase subunit C [Thiotrichales bacterium]|jgi:NADH-quinone oxidoreductase subunit C|nr:NADH-quinone oxidoreductase subunit C [Thiotrichales bacterium]MBT3613458.1 NADH-quinone oxidoreductase subunit C [Thiotrichales bacterium]MBT3753073.1 NADH-quinone oxidoreductase subunit C [Thiotrichales bacterium]MBT3837356.1 NADH-quinone oxidoreductase subunit C [Thiotrichales bacterium]MBT4151620.1 NADH-quinone oxidoreductase subunit C [Thiotrichales bacterium]